MSAVLQENNEAILDWHLSNWARWMSLDRVTRGAPTRACGCTSWGDSWDNDTAESRYERKQAACVNALIDGLNSAQRAAVYHQYLEAVFRFPRDNYAQLLIEARAVIAKGLWSRGMW